MVQRPRQDICTVVMFAAFFLLVAMTGATAVTILEQSGIILSGTTLTGVQTGKLKSPATAMPVYEQNGFNECEVIYHQASQGGEYVFASSGAGQDAMGELHHAVYTCTGISARLSLI